MLVDLDIIQKTSKQNSLLCIAYLPNVLEFPGQSQQPTSCLAVLEAFKIVLEIIHVAGAYTKYKFDRDRMLVGQD